MAPIIERLVVTGRSEAILPEELPMEVRTMELVDFSPSNAFCAVRP